MPDIIISDEELDAALQTYMEAFELGMIGVTGQGSEDQTPAELLARGGRTLFQQAVAVRRFALRAALLAFLRKRYAS